MGGLHEWAGPTQEVVSPMFERQPDGSLTPRVIGSYPLLDEAESLKALDAAVRAYDHGRGEWPSMSVAGRKDSAEGTLSVYDALHSFSIRTVVATKQTEANKHLLNGIVDG